MVITQFKDIFPDYNSFKTKVLDKLTTTLGDMSWLQDSNKFYKKETLFMFLANKYNYRYVRHVEEEFLGYFINEFVMWTPVFYSRTANIIEDKLQELQTNENVGVKTKVSGKSKHGSSTTPHNITFDNADNNTMDSTEQSEYSSQSSTDNILDNARKLASSAMSGELNNWVNCFHDLFTQIDMAKVADNVIRDSLYDKLLSTIAVATDAKTLSKNVLTIANHNKLTIDGLLRTIGEIKTSIGDYVVDDPNGKLDRTNIIDNLVDVVEDVETALNRISDKIDKTDTDTAHWSRYLYYDVHGNITYVTPDELADTVSDAKWLERHTQAVGPYTHLGGVYPTLNDVPDSEKNGSWVLVGSQQPYTIYTWRNNRWESIGSHHGLVRAVFGDGSNVNTQTGPAYSKQESDLRYDPIVFYKDQIITFKEVKNGTKFEDSTLFSKELLMDGATLVSGIRVSGGYTYGEVQRHRHDSGVGVLDPDTAKYGISNSGRGVKLLSPVHRVRSESPYTDYVGTDDKNYAYGLRIIKVVYVAKRDIKVSEMK